MRILFCVSSAWTRRLGAAKALVELAEELELLAWRCDHICLPDLVPGAAADSRLPAYALALRRYLHERAADYDVVDYDHTYLPYARSEFAPDTLFVARSVLLQQHVAVTPIPQWATLRGRLGRVVRGRTRRRAQEAHTQFADRTVAEADLVNLPNEDAKHELRQRGIPDDKMVVLPFGLARAARRALEALPAAPPSDPVVAFVGTFDPRKGATHFPNVFRTIARAVSDVRLRLIGTSGMIRGEADVLSVFPPDLRSRITAVPEYEPEELPRHLAGASVGVFPSYVEGFPFGVLEMLAAAVPVVAYRAPGAPMMLPDEYLVSRGDAEGLGRRAAALLLDRSRLAAARSWARARSREFSWERVARQTADVYAAALERRRAGRTAALGARR
jgi:glycosyltransferase involved in cell wall biosynthesis